MVTTIGINNLRIECIIGVRASERETKQSVFVDAEIDGDFTAATESERVDDTFDYGRVAGLLVELAHRRRFQLLETFASEACRLLLEQQAGVRSVRIEIRKPAAVAKADYAFVRCESHRSADK